MAGRKWRMESLALVALIGVGLGLRIWGMWFGLPQLLHPDEPIFVNAAKHMGNVRSLNPHWFGNPGNVLMYLVLFQQVVYYFLGRAVGWFDGTAAFAEQTFTNPTAIYLMGRSIGVLAGTATIFIVYLIGKRLHSRAAGLVAALLVAFNPLLVEHAKFIRVDILGTLFIALAIHFALKYYDGWRRRDLVLASIAVGLSAAAKYPFAVIGVLVILLAMLQPARGGDPSGRPLFRKILFFAKYSAIALAAFAAVTPYFFIELDKVIHDILYEARGTHLAHESFAFFKNYFWYLATVFPQRIGIPVLLAATAGVVLLLRRQRRRALLVLLFPALFFLVIGAGRLRWAHWTIPLLPFIALFAACAAAQALALCRQRRALRAQIGAALAVWVLLAAYPQLSQSVRLDRAYCLPDTRQLCTEWMRQHLPQAKIAQDFYAFQPYPRYAYLQGSFTFEGYRIYQKFSIADRKLYSYLRAGFTHLIISELQYRRMFQNRDRYPQEVDFYRTLLSQEPIVSFEPLPGRIRGPAIHVFAVYPEMALQETGEALTATSGAGEAAVRLPENE